MSYEAWGEPDDNYWTDDQVSEKEAEAFVRGAQAMRETIARRVAAFEAQGGLSALGPDFFRAVWADSWGDDPGQIEGDIPNVTD